MPLKQPCRQRRRLQQCRPLRRRRRLPPPRLHARPPPLPIDPNRSGGCQSWLSAARSSSWGGGASESIDSGPHRCRLDCQCQDSASSIVDTDNNSAQRHVSERNRPSAVVATTPEGRREGALGRATPALQDGTDCTANSSAIFLHSCTHIRLTKHTFALLGPRTDVPLVN